MLYVAAPESESNTVLALAKPEPGADVGLVGLISKGDVETEKSKKTYSFYNRRWAGLRRYRARLWFGVGWGGDSSLGGKGG